MKVGEVTDTFGNYVELWEPERGEWYIRHIDDCIEAKKEENPWRERKFNTFVKTKNPVSRVNL